MIYVRCLDEQGVSLRAGSIYRVLPPEVNDGNLLRIADETSGEAGSEGGYLFSPESFETVQLEELDANATSSATVYLPPVLYGILRAEALAANTSISGLLCTWIDERLDLPADVVPS